jgi:hypothetical protein
MLLVILLLQEHGVLLLEDAKRIEFARAVRFLVMARAEVCGAISSRL